MAILLALLPAACAPSASPPDVVVVVLDTARADRLTPYGYARETTPVLASLAAEARVFEQAYSTSSWTAPAHASLFSGLYPIAHRTTQESWTLPAAIETLAEILSAHGYESHGVVGNPMISRTRGFDQGFATWTESWRQVPRPRVDAHAAGAVADLLESRTRSAPLFLFVNLIGPHSPYDSCGRHCDRWVSDPGVPIRANHWREYYLGRRDLAPAELVALSERYDGELRRIDELLGEILAALDGNGYGDALLVVTSDHGENLGERGHVDHVFSLYETTTRIPLIVRHAHRFEPGSRDPAPAQLPDVFATVLAAAGIDAAAYGVQGVDLAGPPTARTGGDVFLEYYRPVQALGRTLRTASVEERERVARYDRRIRAIVSDGWKLLWGSDGRHELYHLAVDPAETRDLIDAPEHVERRDDLARRLRALEERYAAEGGEPASPSALPRDTREALEALGYAE